MGSFCVDDYYGLNGVTITRPTFLALSLKRNGFLPTLPRTPEHGISHESLHGATETEIANWDILTSSRYEDQQEYDDDSDVFVLPGSCEHKVAVATECQTSPQLRTKAKTEFGFCPSADGDSERTESQKHCCSEWIRSYFSKLWVKNGNDKTQSELPISTIPRPCTILERETTLKRLSPKRMRRLSKKRHSAASSFIYAAFLEDTVIELREERHKDVVYSITIKKDGSLQRNGSLNKSFLDDDSVKERNTSRHMKGATLDFMVDRLAEVFSGENDDVNYLNVFLTTYRTFATPAELFRKLKDKYMELNAAPLKDLHAMKSIMRVFRAWLERYFVDDFQESGNNKILTELYELAKLHDDITNQNEVDSSRCKNKTAVSPIHQRMNGLMHTVGFTDLVAAKVAVVAKSKQTSQAVESPQVSPSRLHNPDLDISENSTINTSPAKILLNNFSSTHVATQLTVIAAKLFHRVKPHHCLATVSSPKTGRPQTVRATINQFNKVVYCVIGTVLCRCLKVSQRTKLLTKWIEVAQECRELKNFSSLRAIVSGLQTHSLHRLKKAWTGVPPSHMNLLTELAEMNMKDLLMKVGTAKVNTEDSAITRVRKEATIRREQDMHSGIMHGTVPYLGSFLTDLTYLDTARPNFLEGGLINFEKRRKEFELLAQLQLWQASCRSYQNLTPDEEFMTWFQSITVLSEEQSFALSELIEPPVSSVSSPMLPVSPGKKTAPEVIHGETDKNTPLHSWQKNQRKTENGFVGRDANKSSTSCAGRINSTPSPSDKNRAVRIRLIRRQGEAGTRRAEAGVDYKTISISSDERRAAVIKKALESFMLDAEENHRKFSLVQLLHDKEIQIPDTANVFYAMSSSDQDPTLLLLEDGAVIPQKTKRHQSTPNRTKKTKHRKNASLTYTREPESGRASPIVTNTKSPMKALFSQLAFSSVAIAGSSYSISDASSRRSSEGDSEIAGSDGVVLTNSRSGIELVDLDTNDEAGVDVCLPNITNRRTSRCYSADYGGSGVILPIRVVRSSRALSSSEQKLITIKSAPASPNKNERKYSNPAYDDDDNKGLGVITATGRLTEWPRYSASSFNSTSVGRSSTWSSRRAMRRPKKTRHTSSTFYVSNQVVEDTDIAASVELKLSGDCTNTPRPQTLFTRSTSARTLPGRFMADFSGHDYDDDDDVTKSQKSSSSRSFDSSNNSSPPVNGRRATSFASVSSGASDPNDQNSGLSFSADIATSARNTVNDDRFTDSDGSSSSDLNTSPVFSTRPPLIKVQSPSPNHIGNESGYFERCTARCSPSDSDSSSECYKNVEDVITVL